MKELTIQEIYNIIGSSRDKVRAFFGIAVDILMVEDKVITIRVEQTHLVNNYILNQSELVNRAGQLFEKIDGYKLHFKTVVYSLDASEITLEWVEKKMREFGLKRKDLVKQLAIEKPTLDLYFSGKSKLDKSQRAAFFYYFLTYELNRDFRKDD